MAPVGWLTVVLAIVGALVFRSPAVLGPGPDLGASPAVSFQSPPPPPYSSDCGTACDDDKDCPSDSACHQGCCVIHSIMS